jgi:hypothetical protein
MQMRFQYREPNKGADRGALLSINARRGIVQSAHEDREN